MENISNIVIYLLLKRGTIIADITLSICTTHNNEHNLLQIYEYCNRFSYEGCYNKLYSVVTLLFSILGEKGKESSNGNSCGMG